MYPACYMCKYLRTLHQYFSFFPACSLPPHHFPSQCIWPQITAENGTQQVSMNSIIRNSSPPGQKSSHFTDHSFKCIFMNSKRFLFQFVFHWCLLLRVQLTLWQHWSRSWLVACPATSHDLNQCWPSSPTHMCGTTGRLVNLIGPLVVPYLSFRCNCFQISAFIFHSEVLIR